MKKIIDSAKSLSMLMTLLLLPCGLELQTHLYIYIYGIDLDPHRFTPKWVMPKIQTEKLAGRPAISWELEVYFPRKICDFSRVKLLIGGG